MFFPGKFLYNGKELVDDHNLFWFEFGWRPFDPQIVRWVVADPVDEFYSSYIYGNNNPINGVDPDGKEWFRIVGRKDRGYGFKPELQLGKYPVPEKQVATETVFRLATFLETRSDDLSKEFYHKPAFADYFNDDLNETGYNSDHRLLGGNFGIKSGDFAYFQGRGNLTIMAVIIDTIEDKQKGISTKVLEFQNEKGKFVFRIRGVEGKGYNGLDENIQKILGYKMVFDENNTPIFNTFGEPQLEKIEQTD